MESDTMRDFLGRKLSKKEVLEENQRSGKQSEILHVGLAADSGFRTIQSFKSKECPILSAVDDVEYRLWLL